MQTILPLRLTLLIFFTLATLSSAVAADTPKHPKDIERITMAELQALQANNEMVVIIDTRTPGQWQQAADKIPGAIRVDSQSALIKLKSEFPPDTEIVAYCTWPSEGSSASLALTLMKNGFTRVRPLLGGYHAWIKSGLPVEKK